MIWTGGEQYEDNDCSDVMVSGSSVYELRLLMIRSVVCRDEQDHHQFHPINTGYSFLFANYGTTILVAVGVTKSCSVPCVMFRKIVSYSSSL
nr:hypothetical protein CFP56_04170 [Quercus suber]